MNKLIAILKEKSISAPEKVIFNFLNYDGNHCIENEVTYGELFKKAYDFASFLYSKGIKYGDRVVILSNNSKENLYAVYGSIMIGAIFTLIPAPTDKNKEYRLESVARFCTPKIIITNSEIDKEVDIEKLKNLLGAKYSIANINEIGTSTDNFEIYSGNDDDIIYLQYSSGSTNAPKGVKVSAGNLHNNILDMENMFPVEKSRNLLSWVPFFHNIGLVGVLFLSVYVERKAYVMKTEHFMANPSNWLKAITDYKIELTPAPNSAYDLCIKIIDCEQAKNFDLSSLNYIANGSEVVSSQTVTTFAERFNIGKDKFVPCFGLAESVCLVSADCGEFKAYKINYDAYKDNKFMVDEADDRAKEVVSLGEISKSSEVVITSINKPVLAAEGEIGEICIKGPCVAKGYWEDIEDNDNFKYQIEDKEGYYLRTGDLGVLYNGNLIITGRLKELIIINGHNVYPNDIKVVLQEKIQQIANEVICVFSFSADRKENVVICIETNKTSEELAKLSGEISSVVNKYFSFSPFEVLFVKKNSLMRTDNGKLKVHKIRGLYKIGCLDVLYSNRTSTKKIEMNEDTDYKFSDEIEVKVKKEFDKIISNHEYKLTDSFLELGGNSFDTLELVANLEKEFDVSLDVKEILVEPSVVGIAQYIRNKVYFDNVVISKTDLYNECKLDESIVMEREYTHNTDESKSFFLTGSTGFLGAHLIKSIIEQNRPRNIKIYCHCRAKNEEMAMERIINNMNHYECWLDEYKSYIIPVLGDLEKPHMGINDEVYNKLTEEIDCVYHNGALLNFMFPYEYLRKSNVFGTEECIRFACKGKAKYFNYISSFSVFDNPSHFNTVAYETDPLESADGYFLGYSETKWVSEKIVDIARKRGVKATIYRPGDITGSREKGIWDMGDLVSRVLVSCIEMKKMPDVNVNIFFTPVDFVSDAIINLSLNNNCVNKAFNIVNTDIINIDELKRIFIDCGYQVEKVPYSEWQLELLNSETGKNSLKILDCLFKESDSDERCIVRRYGDLEAEFDTTQMDHYLEGTGLKCLPVDKELISGYLSYFAKKGYIKQSGEKVGCYEQK